MRPDLHGSSLRRARILYVELAFSLLLFAAGFSACEKSSEVRQVSTDPQVMSSAQLIGRGKAIYVSNCTACHHPSDPSKAGSIGPDLASATIELLESKVLHNRYPESYQPKRNTQLMVALPHLKNEIPAIHAYLKSTAEKQ